ncbi:MAG: IS3 family transposase [Chitinophagales bacterium]
MKALYTQYKTTKQSLWKWRKREVYLLDQWLLLEPVLSAWRGRHPSMGLKKLYACIKPDFIGRDRFIAYALAYGLEAIRYQKKSKSPNTSATSTRKTYPNLLLDLNIVDIDMVWVSDTTYFKIKDKWHYITFIMDLYSRYILGYHAAENLLATANMACLKMALNTRGVQRFTKKKPIHHSDRGAQYKSHDYIDALVTAGMQPSMGRIVYDNIHVERLNQTIKGEYLIHRNITSLNDLKKHLKKDVKLYNEERPHDALGWKTPLEFERYICNIPLCERTKMKVFALKTKTSLQQTSTPENELLQAKQLQFLL